MDESMLKNFRLNQEVNVFCLFFVILLKFLRWLTEFKEWRVVTQSLSFLDWVENFSAFPVSLSFTRPSLSLSLSVNMYWLP